MATCTSCGRDVSGKKFCPDCGTPVQAAPTQVATTTCPRCGGSIRDSAAFCMHCGSSLGAQALAASTASVTAVAQPTTQQCPACHVEVASGNTFCTNCGQSLVPTSANATSQVICAGCSTHNNPGARFCNNCGQALTTGAPQPYPQANTSYPQQPYTQPQYNSGYQQPYSQPPQYNPNPGYQQPYAQAGYQQEPMLGQQPMVLRCPVCMAMSPMGTPACPSCHTSLAGIVPTPGAMPMQNQQGGMFQGNGGNMMMGALGGAAAVIGGEMLLNGLERRHDYDRYGYERRDDGLLGDLGELGRDIGLL